MGTPFMSEIKIVSFNFAPKGWALCNGQFLPINQNQALFSLLGTMYGGNGQTTFALPDLRGRMPIHVGSGFTQGQAGGQEFHTIINSEMPSHTHFMFASNVAANTTGLNGNMLAQAPGGIYGPATNLTTLLPSSVSSVGGSQPHENRMPTLVLAFIIALQGVFPSPN